MKSPSWAALLRRNATLLRRAAAPLRARQRPPAAGGGAWLGGVVMAADGPRRYALYRPPGARFGERLPLLVMLHGCHQDARTFAASTRMNALAARERFLVLYPEQPRLAHLQGCWNWFDTEAGRADTEAAWILRAMDQVGVLYAADPARTAVAGLSAGASMAALLATRHPQRFCAVAMHSGVPPGLARSAAQALGAMRGRTPAATPAPAVAAGGDWPPLLVIHGEGDGVVSARNGVTAARQWAEAAGATATEPRMQRRGARHPMTVTDFKRGACLAATLVQVQDLGHAWSGGAAGQRFGDTRGPDASRMVWRFVARQFGAMRG